MDERPVFPMRARGVGVEFGRVRALDRVDLDVDRGAALAVLGANGAGKSVLLRALHGLVAPTSGSITWASATGRPPAQAMVFQRPVLLRRSAIANVAYALHVNGVRGGEAQRRARAALDHVNLGHLADRQARVLSGGEQQRLALARAWALEPQLLFLDEPTSSLDPTAAADVEAIIRDIHGSGTSVVFATHNLGFARRFARDIAFLHAGTLVEVTRADLFFRNPASPEAARFLEGELPWTFASPDSSSA